MESSFMRSLLSVGVLCTENKHLITSVMMVSLSPNYHHHHHHHHPRICPEIQVKLDASLILTSNTKWPFKSKHFISISNNTVKVKASVTF